MAKYLKPDCELGYVENNAEINYLKFNNLRHTVLGCMLGDFDNVGNYYVQPEIVKELISMPKNIVESVENIDICHGELKLDKYITFLVTFQADKAMLSLIEKLNYEANIKLNSGTYNNINEYVLDEVETSGVVNRNVIYARWNINQFPGMQHDVFNCDPEILEKYFGIVNRFKYLLKANTKFLEREAELEEIEAEYANNVFDILKRYPKLEAEVIKQLKQTIEQKKDFIRIDKPNFTKTLNEIIDKSIEENQKVLTAEEKIEFDKDVENTKNITNIKRADLLSTKTTELTEENNFVEIIDVENTFEDIATIAASFVAAKKREEERLVAPRVQTDKNEKNKLHDRLVTIGIIHVEVVQQVTEVQTAPVTATPAANTVATASSSSGGGGGSSSGGAKKGGKPAKKSGGKDKVKGKSDTNNSQASTNTNQQAEDSSLLRQSYRRRHRDETAVTPANAQEVRSNVIDILSSVTEGVVATEQDVDTVRDSANNVSVQETAIVQTEVVVATEENTVVVAQQTAVLTTGQTNVALEEQSVEEEFESTI